MMNWGDEEWAAWHNPSCPPPEERLIESVTTCVQVPDPDREDYAYAKYRITEGVPEVVLLDDPSFPVRPRRVRAPLAAQVVGWAVVTVMAIAGLAALAVLLLLLVAAAQALLDVVR